MKLGIITTAHCNAACSHCSTSCGPQRTERLDRAKIFNLMDEAAQLSQGEPLKFGFTGGEPFLDFELLLKLIAHGKKVGAHEVTCVTNGYWATSPEKARARLTAVKQAGLDVLAVSTSRFHRQFVKIQRVERVLNASREVGLNCALKIVHTQSDAGETKEMEAWGRAAGAYRVEVFAVLPHLRKGAILPGSEYRREQGLPEGRCPAPIITVHETGEAYTCATPGTAVDFLSLGDTHELGLDQVRDRFYFGGRQQILREHGPIHFAREIIAREQGHRLREGGYASICDLCAHIVSDPALAAIAAESAQAFEVRQFEDLLGRLAKRGPARQRSSKPQPSAANRRTPKADVLCGETVLADTGVCEPPISLAQ